jgi:hypothetical protein
VVAGTTVEGSVLASVRSVGVGSARPCGGSTTDEGVAWAYVFSVGEGSGSHCGGGHDR